ncbi:flagellar protein FlgN [Fictibacillus iocasae]|uniref:Flagellar protein FlgN n=1 Tax=Fictibacillus iocasae TaxID=2715437 RepID=A0ABW2NT53_9BACL
MEASNMINLLDHLNEIHKKLITLGQQKTEAINKGDMQKLNSLLKEEDGETKELQNIEVERQQHFAGQTVSDIAEKASGSERERLSSLQHELSQNYQSLKEVNELNQQLLQQSLQFVNMSLSTLLPEKEPVTYTKPQGKRYGSAGASLFDSKA